MIGIWLPRSRDFEILGVLPLHMVCQPKDTSIEQLACPAGYFVANEPREQPGSVQMVPIIYRVGSGCRKIPMSSSVV